MLITGNCIVGNQLLNLKFENPDLGKRKIVFGQIGKEGK